MMIGDAEGVRQPLLRMSMAFRVFRDPIVPTASRRCARNVRL